MFYATGTVGTPFSLFRVTASHLSHERFQRASRHSAKNDSRPSSHKMSASRLDLDDTSFKLEYIFYAIVGLVLVSVAGGALAAYLMDTEERAEYIRDHPLPGKKKARKNE